MWISLRVSRRITINDMMNADQVIELLNTMMQDIMREFAQKRQ